MSTAVQSPSPSETTPARPHATGWPAVSVVVPCFNAGPWIAHQLEAMTRQKFDRPWEIVVVDNGSTDNSVEATNRYADRLPMLRLIHATGGRGPGYARNIGVRAARGSFVAFCDADDVVADDWLAAMARALQTHAFVGCRLEHRRLNPEWLVASRHGTQQDGLLPDAFLDVAGAGTLGIQRDIFLAVGGFDEHLPTHEDHEFCWRVQLAGTPLVFAGDAVIHYRYRPNLSGTFRQARRYGRDKMTIIRRYRELGHAVPSKTWRGFARECSGMILGLPRVVGDRSSFAKWASEFGYRLGMLAGYMGRRS